MISIIANFPFHLSGHGWLETNQLIQVDKETAEALTGSGKARYVSVPPRREIKAEPKKHKPKPVQKTEE